MKNDYEVTIIGAGPAGIMAAIAASQKGKKVVLLERNNRAGKKLLLTGKGRCNLTTAKPIPQIVEAFGKNGKFLYSAFTKFSNQDLISFFESQGVKTKVEKGQRVFPQSDKAQDILDCLLDKLKKYKVKMINNFRVEKIIRKPIGFTIKSVNDQSLKASNIILATGGKSYPQTGSTGDGYHLAKNLGHQISPLKPALAGLIVKDNHLKDLTGLSLKNVRINFKTKNKILYSSFGEMLFTHQGISGPIVLPSSKIIYEALNEREKVKAILDLKPALTKSQLKKRIFREIHQMPKKEFQNLLKELLPKSLVNFACQAIGIGPKSVNADLASLEVSQLVEFLKGFSFPISSVAPISTAIVTSGGIKISQIDSKNMQSKLVPGLFFAGEVIELDGPTGGYNLQKAFSTGWLAGNSIS
ncbi:NAD(P)/FAD-dependent oxidoreductase [Patescibacteria group bacterium]